MDKKMVKFTKSDNRPEKYSKKLDHEFRKHRLIYLSKKDQVLLFIY